MTPFKIRPKHWYQWVNPWWWKKARIAQKILEYEWENGGKQEAEEAIKNAVLYGESVMPVAWKEEK